VGGRVLPGSFPHLWKNLWKSTFLAVDARKVLIPQRLML
jgi:hypothetical protein